MAKEMTLEELVAKRRAAGDNRYQYICVSGGPTKKATFTAICPVHGEFTGGISAHLIGASCRRCAYEANGLAKRVSLETYAEEAGKIHNNKFTYTALVYDAKGVPTITYTCPDHGQKEQKANNHKSGAGCPDCGIEKIRQSKRYTLDTFIPKAEAVHGKKYTYKALHYDKADITYVEYECPEHGTHKQGLSSHLNSQGCPACFEARRGLQLRYSLEEYTKVASEKHNNKFTYVSLDHETLPSTVTYLCSEHGEHTQSMSSHLSGRGCPECFEKTRGLSLRSTLEEFISKARTVHSEDLGYVYHAIEHGGTQTMIRYTCPIHGEVHQSTSNHLTGTGCPTCSYENRGLNCRYDFDEYVARASSVHEGKYSYSRIHYETATAVVEYICPQHGKHSQMAADHLTGTGCRECGYELVSQAKRHNFEDYQVLASEVHSDKYLYVGLTFDVRSTVHYVCPKHGMHSQSASAHLSGQGCPRCSNLISKPSVEIKEFIESMGFATKQEHRFPGTRKAVDIIVPSLNLAIEYNGNYWHTSEYVESGYHKAKTRLANNSGYRMIHIWSHEWSEKRALVESFLRVVCGKQEGKIFARKTEVTTPTRDEARLFLDTHHIQGAPITGSYLALKHEGVLCAVMCFNHNTSARGQTADATHIELTRFATNTSVVGGFTKLLQAYLTVKPEVKTVVSYSDDRIFEGGVYQQAGFAKMHTTSPNYQYLEKNALYPSHKANYQKSKLIKRFGEEACRGKTERQITEENNIYRIYDCGLTKWLYTRV